MAEYYELLEINSFNLDLNVLNNPDNDYTKINNNNFFNDNPNLSINNDKNKDNENN